MKYNKLNLGQIEVLVNKLGGMDGVQRFLSGELIVSAAPKVWKTWKKIKLGIGLKDAYDLRKALKKADCNIGGWAPAFTVSPEKTEVGLVVVSVAELGFKERATRTDIYKRAQVLGLDLCPNEVGPQLCVQYKDQPKGEWLHIGMEPITDSSGDPHVFCMGRDDGGRRWWHVDSGKPGSFWSADRRWVFLHRK